MRFLFNQILTDSYYYFRVIKVILIQCNICNYFKSMCIED